jgi:DNA excision repair protein ERCC-4
MIYCDVFEPQQIIDELKRKQLSVEVRHLDSGDYVFNDVAIERKTLQDLINSTFDKRLWVQLKTLKNTYKHPLLLIENWTGINSLSIDPKTKAIIEGIITTILVKFDISILVSYNYLETVEWIKSLYIKTGTNKVTYLPAPVKKQKTIHDIKLEMLQVIPTIGPKTAKTILTKCPDIFSKPINGKELQNIKNLHKQGKELLIEVLGENVK